MADTPQKSDDTDPFDLLRREAGDPAPTPEQEAVRLELFRASLAQPPAARHSRKLLVIIGVAAVMIGVTFGVVWLAPSEVEATVGEVAEAARHAADVDIPEGSFLFVRSDRSSVAIRPGSEFGMDRDSVAYIRPDFREVWRSPGSGFIQIRTTASTPEFFDQSAEDAYYVEGLDEDDQIGQTLTEQFTEADDPVLSTEWATDPEPLREQLVQFLEGEPYVDDHALFDVLLDILGEADPSPQLRGALLDVVASLDIEVAETDTEQLVLRSSRGDEIIEATISRGGELNQVRVVTASGDSDLLIPPGTALSDVHYKVRRIVEELPPS